MSDTSIVLSTEDLTLMRGRLQAAEQAHPDEPTTLWLRLYQSDLGRVIPYLEGISISKDKANCAKQDGTPSPPPKSPHTPTIADLVSMLGYLVQSTREASERTQAGLTRDQLREALPHLNSAMACFQRAAGEVA